MATLAFQMIGATLGQSLGGALGATLGRAIGGIGGALIDRAVLGGSGRRRQVGPRLTDLDGISASEGSPIPRVYGRVRSGGQVIWATEFEEETTIERSGSSGGKSSRLRTPQQKTTRYVYSANVAIGLCEGPIAFVRRIWADGKPLDLAGVTYRVYTGTEDQEPDPLIVAKQSSAEVPAFRGLAYIVFERLPLSAYGNRLPQFSFEIVRPLPGLPEMVRTVNLIPGSTEFGYSPTEVREDFGFGNSRALNRSQWTRPTDWDAAIDDLQALCPNLERATLISAWFGDDLRVANCSLRPRTEKSAKVTTGEQWSVAGLTRATALPVSESAGRPNYGGTPSDASVIAAIRDLKARGLKVALHPFILMDILSGNSLPDPYSSSTSQPAFPWRGRITSMPAPGRPGSPAGTAVAATQVANFVGTAQASHFALAGEQVIYTGPAEWSFRRMALHHAMLAKAAGGVETFFIASELVGLTHLQGAGAAYPFVQAMIGLLAELRAILGPATRITYAADWTEYGAHVLDNGQQVRFPLDPLWAHAEIGAVAIDFYPPVTDWRGGHDHLDADEAAAPHDLDFLIRRVAAGEAFDWYYADDAARLAQQRLPITDGAYGKPWIYRPKDLVSWWSNGHRERAGGIESGSNTAWVAQSKPILLAEIGCPAVDAGSNQPNVFPDPKSAESGLPFGSSGARDDLIQRRLLEAMLIRFDADQPGHVSAHNPVSTVYGGRMVMPDFIAPWAYDARPFPAFPQQKSLWADGANWSRGHWLNGRLEAAPVPELIAQILADHGHNAPIASAVAAMADGFMIDRPMSTRAALESLLDTFGLVARMSAEDIMIEPRPVRPTVAVTRTELALPARKDQTELEIVRGEAIDLPRSFRLGFVDSDRDFRRSVAEARREWGEARREISEDSALVLPEGQARLLAERRLGEVWAEREIFRFALPRAFLALEPGDLMEIETPAGSRLVRLTRITDGRERQCEAVSCDPQAVLAAALLAERDDEPSVPPLPGPPFARFIELPFARDADDGPVSAIVRAEPWRAPYTIAEIIVEGSQTALADLVQPARIGTLETTLAPGPLWRWQMSTSFEITLQSGALASLGEVSTLSGGNALGLIGPDGEIEILLFQTAELVGPKRYRLSGLLRGIGLSESAAMRTLAPGATVFALDDAVLDIGLAPDRIGDALELAVIPAGRDVADATTIRQTMTVAGRAYRPLAPVHARARRDVGGIRLSFIRRTRFGGDSWELYEVPLGEAREEYRVEIREGNVVRRVLNSTQPDLLYAAADEIADFGAAQTSLELAIAQVSARVGPGEALIATIPVN